MKRTILTGLIILLTVALIWLGLIWQPQQSTPVKIGQAPRGGDFTLTSAAGPVQLKSMRGKVVVLFFGYTMCPDVCPTSMSLLSIALDGLPAAEMEQVQGLFISVDPERDNLERLKAYSAYFHSRIQGVTGTNEQIAAVAKQYGAAYKKDGQDSAADYVVDHTADLYVIDQTGRLQSIVRHGTPPSELLALLRQLLNNHN